MEKVSKMSMREAILTVAGGSYPTKRLWEVASRKSGVISYRTIKSLWNNEIKKDDHWAKREIRRQAEIAKAKQEARDLAATYEQIARGLNVTDQDFHREDVAALLHAARILRAQDSA